MGIYEDFAEVLEYMKESEKPHFEECEFNKENTENHIYTKIKRVDDWFNSPYCPLVSSDELEEDEDLNYMDDSDENPLIEGDIREVLKELNKELDYSVERHEMGDGKHRVFIDGVYLYVNGWTLRKEFKEDIKEQLQ